MQSLILKAGQWEFNLQGEGPEFEALVKAAEGKKIEIKDYLIHNPGPDGDRYYKVIPGKFFAPIVFQEPVLGLTLPSSMLCVDSSAAMVSPNKEDRLVGVVLTDAQGNPVIRASMTNLVNKKLDYSLDPSNGHFTFQGVEFHLNATLCPDVNRLDGFVGFGVEMGGRGTNLPTKRIELGNLRF